MRKNVVIAKVGHDGYGEIVGGIGVVDVVVLAKDLDELMDQHIIQLDDLLFGAWYEFISVVSSRVAGPDDEVGRCL